ncbi:MAG: hypothetical protein M3Z80_02740 [Apibacter sp.]|uniref:hypothetical protein n=1 Tax=Apibacter sp. TaxID=2023709 RepID=UPI0025F31835|nr:hypothetical protein [Apibacter sp.]MCT6868845.1 hypothetical protein [Apibacter sp.]
MKNISTSKIFILCPANNSTGGPEALHQLSHKLRTKLNLDAKMYYIQKKSNIDPKPKVYNIYDTLEIDTIEDHSDNIIIIPESLTNYIYKFYKSKKIIWWLSVDFYSICMKNRHRGLKFYLSKYIKGKKEDKEYYFENLPNVYHWAQSYRSYLFLLKNKVPVNKISFICDYVNPLFFKISSKENSTEYKENIIIYNPKKNKKEIRKIINKSSQFKWIAIKNMTPMEVVETMNKAKIYVDFGYNPGRDKMLRESSVMNCIIISGKGGSSLYQKDLNIPEEYKFEFIKENYSKIISKIEQSIENYEKYIIDFVEYRKEVLEEETQFENLLKVIFSK